MSTSSGGPNAGPISLWLRTRPLTIRFTEPGVSDLSLRVDSIERLPTDEVDELLFDAEADDLEAAAPSWVPLMRAREEPTVRQLKQDIRALRPAVANRRIRLIHAGQLLRDGIRIVPWLDTLDSHRSIEDNDEISIEQIHVSDLLPDSGKGKERQLDESVTTQRRIAPTVYVQASIGDGNDTEDPVPAPPAPVEEETETRGFDRLRSAGLSEADIELMRAQFHRATASTRSGDVLREQEEQEHARALEDQWIESLAQNDPPQEDSPLFQTILEGLLLGFFLPLAPLFFLRGDRPHPSAFPTAARSTDDEDDDDDRSDNHPHANVIFSKNMRVAIVFGLTAKYVSHLPLPNIKITDTPFLHGPRHSLLMGAFRLLW